MSKDEGDSRVGSLFPFNRVMLFRWRWIIFHCYESLWVGVEHMIYGTDGR